MRFDKVIVAGSAQIAIDCVQYISEIIEKEKIVVIETKFSALSLLERNCRKQYIQYKMLDKKQEIEDALMAEATGKAVFIISANNEHIFSPSIIDQAGVEIINFHYALLPHYRGMNIPTWVIYNGEKETGITWHFVTEQIDHGRIIARRKIPIEETTTPLEISRRGMKLGAEAFGEFIGKLLETPIDGEDIIYPENEIVYRRSMLPEGGILNLEKQMDSIIHLLRSFDYGGFPYIPYLNLRYDEEDYLVRKYRVKTVDGETDREYRFLKNKLIITEKGKEVVLHLNKK